MNTSKVVAEKNATNPTNLNGKDQKTIPQDALVMPGIKPEERKDVSYKVPTIEARLKKLDELTELAERRETVTTALGNLEGFYISPDGGSGNLKLTDSKGRVFAISHPSVIGEMVSLAKAKLSAELNRIESLIDFSI